MSKRGANLDPASIRARIEALSHVEGARRVHGAAHHGWRLEPPWEQAELERFEQKRRVTLPAAYRRWLLELGASGAGPGCGLFLPGTWTLGKSAAWTGRQYGPLGRPFPVEQATRAHRGAVPGAMPVCDLGCGSVGLLVTAGPLAGRIWVHDRTDGELRPEGGFDFAEWIERWLSAAEREAADPWVPPARHPNEPDRLIPAADVLPADALRPFVDDVLLRLERDGKVRFGALGELVRRGRRADFDQGPALKDALLDQPLPDVPVLTPVFAAVLAAPVWTAVELPGLLQAWIRESAPVAARDYLGRPYTIGAHERAWTVRSLI